MKLDTHPNFRFSEQQTNALIFLNHHTETNSRTASKCDISTCSQKAEGHVQPLLNSYRPSHQRVLACDILTDATCELGKYVQIHPHIAAILQFVTKKIVHQAVLGTKFCSAMDIFSNPHPRLPRVCLEKNSYHKCSCCLLFLLRVMITTARLWEPVKRSEHNNNSLCGKR